MNDSPRSTLKNVVMATRPVIQPMLSISKLKKQQLVTPLKSVLRQSMASLYPF